MTAWGSLRDAFERAEESGRRARLWLRDDDAAAVTPALLKLAGMARDAKAPVVLAVIPAPAEAALGTWVRERPHLFAAVHGYAHRNHAAAGAKRQELGLNRPVQITLAELQAGRDRIDALFGPRAISMLVPPWNNIDHQLVHRLPALGFQTLSAFGPEWRYPNVPGLEILNAHVDPIDWRGTRGCRPHDELVVELVRLVDEKAPDGAPIGIVTHHLNHDAAAWAFLERLIEAANGRAEWIAPA